MDIFFFNFYINSKKYLNKLNSMFDANIFTKFSQAPILSLEDLGKLVDGLSKITSGIGPTYGSVK
mgnify:CR=1 FL=1